MKHALIVGIGGFAGAIARYKIGGQILHHTTNWKLPVSTLVVNIVGCLLIGFLGGFFEKHHFISRDIKLLLITGILGGFTTFSAFGFETVFLLKRGQIMFAILNVVLSVGCGVIAVWAGLFLGELYKV